VSTNFYILLTFSGFDNQFNPLITSYPRAFDIRYITGMILGALS